MTAPRAVSTVTVLSGGVRLDERWHVVAVEVEHALGRVPAAQVLLRDGDVAQGRFAIAAADALRPGEKITIKAGVQSKERVVFRGVAVRQTVQSERDRDSALVVVCKGAAVKMTRSRRSAHRAESTEAELMKALVEAHGLKADVTGAPTKIADLVQLRCSDWDLLNARACANGLVVGCWGDEVRVFSPTLKREPKKRVTYGEDIYELTLELDAETQVGEVTAAAWSAADQEPLESEAPDPGRLGPGDTDPLELARSVGAGAVREVHGGALGPDALDAWSAGIALRSRLSQVRGEVVIAGDGELRPGDVVQLRRLGRRFDGRALVSAVSHRISPGRWTTTLRLGLDPEPYLERVMDAAPAPAGGRNVSAPGLQVGVVTAVHGDPDGAARVRVRMPMVDQSGEGAWARLATGVAGPDRGLAVRPEVGDEVVLGFLDGDPSQPVVLGGVHSAGQAPPEDGTDDNDHKVYVSRAGVRVAVDEGRAALRVETPGGRVLVLDDESGEVTVEDKRGNRVRLTNDGVTVESNSDLSLTANGKVSITGATVELG